MRPSNSIRRCVAIAALLVFSVLLLKPACDVLALHSAPSQATPMAILHHSSDGALSAAASAAKGIALDAALAGTMLVVPAFALPPFRVAVAGGAAPPLHSYYARSARVLR